MSISPHVRYYRYNEDSRSVDPEYPKPINVWQGVPDNIKAGIMSRDQGNHPVCFCVRACGCMHACSGSFFCLNLEEKKLSQLWIYFVNLYLHTVFVSQDTPTSTKPMSIGSSTTRSFVLSLDTQSLLLKTGWAVQRRTPRLMEGEGVEDKTGKTERRIEMRRR